jgi:hypothetical protein
VEREEPPNLRIFTLRYFTRLCRSNAERAESAEKFDVTPHRDHVRIATKDTKFTKDTKTGAQKARSARDDSAAGRAASRRRRKSVKREGW